MFFNRLTVSIVCIFICAKTHAQVVRPQVKFGAVAIDDFKPVSYSPDTSADAVCLYEEGKSYLEGSSFEGYLVVTTVFKRIRLLSKKRFDIGTVSIPLYSNGTIQTTFDSLEANTYNLKNGELTITPVGFSNVFEDKPQKHFKVVKFSFPALEEGCIIEYKYRTKISSYAFIPSWTFQEDYPKLWSQYSIEVPANFDFVILSHGFLTPTVDSAWTVRNAKSAFLSSGGGGFSSVNAPAQVAHRKWAYQNVPAIKKENYTTALDNYKQTVEFQVRTAAISTLPIQDFYQTWPDAAKQLMKNDDFGQDLTKSNDWLDDDVKLAIGNETDKIAKAKKIYQFTRGNYLCFDHSAIFLSQPLKKTQQSRKGNVADINMLLAAMLIHAGYRAEPMILSTRDHGKTYDLYPLLVKYNYLVVRLSVDESVFLLDASDQHLAFGKLTANCYNGKARVISKQAPSFDLTADSLHEVKRSSLFLNNDENGVIAGSFQSVLGEIDSYELRKEMENSNQDQYFADIKKTFLSDVDISNTNIDSLTQLDMPVAIRYDLSFKPEGDIIYFNPMFPDAITENPFSAAERLYPVEMPSCTDESFVLNMEVPSGYKVDELPKPERITLNDNDGMFEYLIQQTGDHIQLLCRTKLKKANFEPNDYETLRNFFSMIVTKENEQIVFKKQ
jgi:hypothetical protein